MIGLEVKEARVFVRPGCTDMRKQINSLAVMAEQVMEANVFEPALFLFCKGEPLGWGPQDHRLSQPPHGGTYRAGAG
jgi:hypothetical protein